MQMCFILQSIVLVESKMTANVFVSNFFGKIWHEASINRLTGVLPKMFEVSSKHW